MALAKTIVLNENTKPDYWAVPSAVFSHPELATVVRCPTPQPRQGMSLTGAPSARTQGYSEEGALAAGHPDLDIFTTTFKPMRNQLSGSPLRNMMKVGGHCPG